MFRKSSLLSHALGVAGVVLVVVVATWIFFGKLVAERTLTQLALPGGLLTLALGYASFLAFKQQASTPLRFIVAGCCAAYVLIGGNFVNEVLFHHLQKEFFDTRPLLVDSPYDTLIVLGGGLQVAEDGRIIAGEGGDRVVLAARMANAGKARSLMLAGTKRSADTMAEPDAATELLVQLGVDRQMIQHIEGKNTIDELRSAAAALERSKPARVGIVTSAWHMPRALRLAKSHGIDAEPVPADFRCFQPRLRPDEWVPNGSGFKDFGVAAKEYLAALVGR